MRRGCKYCTCGSYARIHKWYNLQPHPKNRQDEELDQDWCGRDRGSALDCVIFRLSASPSMVSVSVSVSCRVVVVQYSVLPTYCIVTTS